MGHISDPSEFRVRYLMSLPEYLFSRLAADIRQQMDGVLALTEQLARSRLPADAQTCVAGVEETATGVRRLLDAVLEMQAVGAPRVRPEP